jgi:atypical dual specificity phosphatase
MSAPSGFSWIDKPHLAAMACPATPEELHWLRSQGIELLLSLTEDRLRRDWVNDAGLLVFHEPIPDMAAPDQEQLDRCVSAIERARAQNLGVAVHCGAGLGRTGVIVACYLVSQGMSAQNAIARVRRLRPGSIETEDQADAVVEFARRKGQPLDRG